MAEVLLRVSQLLWDFSEIREIDINPLRVFQEKEGCQALDARIILVAFYEIINLNGEGSGYGPCFVRKEC